MSSTITERQTKVYDVNGKTFTTLNEAKNYSARLELQEWANKESLCRGGEWSQDMILDCIIESANELLPIIEKLQDK